MEKFPHAHISANGNLTPSYREGGTIPQSVCFPRNLWKFRETSGNETFNLNYNYK